MSQNGELSFFFQAPMIESEKINLKDSPSEITKEYLTREKEVLESISEADWDMTTIKDSIMAFADSLPKRGPALHPLRYSLSGLERSPDPFTIAAIIGKKETLTRVTHAIGKL